MKAEILREIVTEDKAEMFDMAQDMLRTLTDYLINHYEFGSDDLEMALNIGGYTME